MDKKKLMLLLGALVIAIGTALAARSLFTGASTPKAEAVQAVPQVVNGARFGRRPWMAASVVAAGFVAVAGVLVLTRGPASLPPGPTLAQGAAGLQGVNASAPMASLRGKPR